MCMERAGLGVDAGPVVMATIPSDWPQLPLESLFRLPTPSAGVSLFCPALSATIDNPSNSSYTQPPTDLNCLPRSLCVNLSLSLFHCASYSNSPLLYHPPLTILSLSLSSWCFTLVSRLFGINRALPSRLAKLPNADIRSTPTSHGKDPTIDRFMRAHFIFILFFVAY